MRAIDEVRKEQDVNKKKKTEEKERDIKVCFPGLDKKLQHEPAAKTEPFLQL